MRKIYLSLSLLLASFSLKAQVINIISNGDFETWTNDNKADGWGGYVDAPVLGFLSTPTYIKETQNVFDQSASMQIVTSDFTSASFGLISVREGLAFTGAIANNAIQPAAFAGTSQPEALNLAFMYEPVNGDTAIILSYFFKWNTTTNQRDTIGFGGFMLDQAVPQYYDYTYNITWQSTDIPDSMVVLLTSSGGYAPQVNSKLYADNISFTFASGQKASINNFIGTANIFPNPSNDKVSIVLNEIGNYKISLNDLKGNQLKAEEMVGNKYEFDLSELSAGVYFVNVLNLESGKSNTYKVAHIK